MTTIVFSLKSGAVTEFDLPLTGIDGSFETDSAGVYKISGTESVTSTVAWGMNLSDLRQRPRYLYLFGTNLGGASVVSLNVANSAGANYTYSLQMVHDRVARFEIGRGIRDNYLDMTLTMQSALPITIDAMDDKRDTSTNRRL